MSQPDESAPLRVRPERPEDAAAVRAVNDLAFKGEAEGALVRAVAERLGSARISLIAEREGEVIGHILFCPAELDPPSSVPLWVLGPMAVAPERQRSGVGGALIRAGLEACRERGAAAVFVLGHPSYYPRFGFDPAPPRGWTCAWDVPPEVFMGLVYDDALPPGKVVYPPEFNAV